MFSVWDNNTNISNKMTYCLNSLLANAKTLRLLIFSSRFYDFILLDFYPLFFNISGMYSDVRGAERSNLILSPGELANCPSNASCLHRYDGRFFL